jgi:isocitrate lyase
MAGKVLVPVREHIDRLIAMRLQLDVMGTENVIVARTDSEAATLITSTIDPRDHPFILGSTNASLPSLYDAMAEAEAKGASGSALADVEDKWLAAAKMCTYAEAVKEALSKTADGSSKVARFDAEWKKAGPFGLSNSTARKLAKSLGADPYWDWDACRSREGYYRVRGGVEYCVVRAIAFAPYADLLWMETKVPSLDEARYFSKGVLSVHPWAMLSYNLSPSFNWDATKMTDAQLKDFVWELGRMGYVFQFITLAGFHADSLVISTFARDYAKEGMVSFPLFTFSISIGDRSERWF